MLLLAGACHSAAATTQWDVDLLATGSGYGGGTPLAPKEERTKRPPITARSSLTALMQIQWVRAGNGARK